MADLFTSLVALKYKYLVFALIGAAAKTYADWQVGKCQKGTLLLNIIGNSILALTIAFIVTQVFLSNFPDEPEWAWPISFLSGLVGVNITLALAVVEWKPLIKATVEKYWGQL